MCRNSLNMLTWLLINNVTEKLVFYLREREEASTNYNKNKIVCWKYYELDLNFLFSKNLNLCLISLS